MEGKKKKKRGRVEGGKRCSRKEKNIQKKRRVPKN